MRLFMRRKGWRDIPWTIFSSTGFLMTIKKKWSFNFMEMVGNLSCECKIFHWVNAQERTNEILRYDQQLSTNEGKSHQNHLGTMHADRIRPPTLTTLMSSCVTVHIPLGQNHKPLTLLSRKKINSSHAPPTQLSCSSKTPQDIDLHTHRRLKETERKKDKGL